jgi:hypothetical protein
MNLLGTVEAVVQPGVYLVRDAKGYRHRAASVTLYRKGERVLVIDGMLIGPAGKPPESTIYEV